ncbi:MAG: imelysin family protein [Acidimicrobiales bacterium]
MMRRLLLFSPVPAPVGSAPRPETRRRRVAASALVAGLVITGCGSSDDGATVRDLGAEDGSSETASGSGTASGTGSGTASGLAADPGAAATSDDPLLVTAVEEYHGYAVAQVAEAQAATLVMTDAIRAGDLEAARSAYAASRVPWERIEPIAGLVPELDGTLDGRVDDFTGPDDPAFTGWHRIEYLLWEQGDVAAAVPFADQLDADLATLAETVPTLELTAGMLTVGAQELIEEVAAPDGKLSGEEDRYSGTDLYDMKANTEGSEALIGFLTPALTAADPDLLDEIEDSFEEVDGQMAEFGSYEAGFASYDEVTEEQRSAMSASFGELAEELAEVNAALGLS